MKIARIPARIRLCHASNWPGYALIKLVVGASLHFVLFGAQIDRIGGEGSDTPYYSTYTTDSVGVQVCVT